jgi:hypothetical protein
VSDPRRNPGQPAIKRLFARSGNRCAFPGCPEALVRVDTIVGEICHIKAASPNGPRYDEHQTDADRQSETNLILLCANHHKMVDTSPDIYTVNWLLSVKAQHEAGQKTMPNSEVDRVLPQNGPTFITNHFYQPVNAVSQGNASIGYANQTVGPLSEQVSSPNLCDLLAIGPNVVCVGDFLSADATEWILRFKEFIAGDIGHLVAFISDFPKTALQDRYILVNSIGDGRVLKEPPSLSMDSGEYIIRCQVDPIFPRTIAHELVSQWAISRETNDLTLDMTHSFACVSGLASLPQQIESVLSLRLGESPQFPDFGGRFAQYFKEFYDSPWLENRLKLEVIRQAAIPFHDHFNNRSYTPLQSVDRVLSLRTLAENPIGKRLPIRGLFQVAGVGRWQRDLSIFVGEFNGCRSA